MTEEAQRIVGEQVVIDTGDSENAYAQYTLRFSKPGTYKYACLVHPAMVGTITIKP